MQKICLNQMNSFCTPLIFAILMRLSILMPTNALLLSSRDLVVTSKNSPNFASNSGKSFAPAMELFPSLLMSSKGCPVSSILGTLSIDESHTKIPVQILLMKIATVAMSFLLLLWCKAC
jgi:hypothetical protein